MEVTIVEGDLLDQDVDVIVNTWNRNVIPWWLLLPQGVSGAIKKRGGTGPFKELRKHGAIPLGGAVLTSAGRLPLKGIMRHVVGGRAALADKRAASASEVGRFETEIINTRSNLKKLMDLSVLFLTTF